MAEYDGGNATSTYGNESQVIEGSYAREAGSQADKIQLRRDTEENWEKENPKLAVGEIGVVTDKRYFKMGDGTNRWNSLNGYGFDGNIVHTTGQNYNEVMSQKAVTDAINNEKNRITQEITNRTTAINTETTNRTNEDTAIKNTMVKSCVSNNEEFNDVVKELYFDKYIASGDITKVSIFRRYTVGNNTIWGMDFTFRNGSVSRATFSSDATIESDDVCVATMEKEDGTELKVYAVIRWGLLDPNSIKTYEPITLQNPTTDVKYHPTINQCIGTHRYSHTARGIKAIKELYIKDLKKNNVAVSKKEFEKYFKLESIAKTPSGLYQMAFSDARETKGGTEFLYIVNYYKQYDENSVFYVDCIANPLNPSINNVATGNKYSFKIYAVVDWNLMEQQTGGSYYYPINSNMLAGCLDKKNSPIIYNYIENEALRTQLAELTSQINNE